VSNTEKLKQFFEQMRGNGNPTAQDIRNAAAATGNVAEILQEILSYAAGMGIDAAAELADFTSAHERARQEKAVQETAAALAEHSGALAVETDPEKRKERIENIRRLAASLGTVENKIFPTFLEIKAEWDAYDPDKDFMPPLLGGAAIKDGTLSYIGARTGIGKTTALINITREAMDAGRKVIFLTLEEPARDITRKLILCDLYANAGESRAVLQKLAAEKGDLTAAFHAARKGKYVKGSTDAAMDFKQKVLAGQEKIGGLYGSRLIFIEGRGLNTAEKQTAAITKHAMPGDIVLIDFIQRIADPDGVSFNNYMKGKAQSETLFNVAKNSGAAVISGAQFKRAVSELPRELAPLGFKPFDVDSFREAGDIEQDGDYLFGIGDHMSDPEMRFLKILKVRSGSGRNRCYSIDFQGAFNYMGIGGRLTAMNPAHSYAKPKRKTETQTEQLPGGSGAEQSGAAVHSTNPLKRGGEQ
jgi:hypothetical protein